MDLTTIFFLSAQIILWLVVFFVYRQNKKPIEQQKQIIDADWKLIKELLNDIVELNLKIDKLQNKNKPGPN